MDAGLIYCNSIIKSRETALLTTDRLRRLMDCASVHEAEKQLAEAGYTAADQGYETMLAAEEKLADEFFCSIMPAGYGLNNFLTFNDYHNAKCVAKKVYFAAGAGDVLKTPFKVPLVLLESAFADGNYDGLPTFMAEALAALAKKKLSDSLMPSEVSYLLDKACFEDIKSTLDAEKVGGVIKQYFYTLFDLTNIAVAARASECGYTFAEAEKRFVCSGEISVDKLAEVYGKSVDEVMEKFLCMQQYKGAFEALKRGGVAFEAYRDNTLLGILKAQKNNMFSPAVVAGYYVGKKREILNCRLITSCIANGVDKSYATERMRELYV